MDAESLLLHVLRKSDPERNRAWLIAHADSPTMPKVGQEFKTLTTRRFAGEPIQYIVGETEFYGLTFRVTPDVLIPRPETEHVVEKVIALAAQFPQPRIVDVGTGSGAIAIALAHELPRAEITATDISTAALGVACENAKRNGVAGRIRFVEGDLLAPVAGETFDFVISNPPYVAERDRDALAVEVRDYEPATALFAGEDGLNIYRRLIPAALAALAPGGFLVVEIGFGQAESLRSLLNEQGFEKIDFTPDLQGIPRVACGQRA
jgi:release factor glutamine methyltransferase